ncbi:hypothetical protein GCM10009599_21000 [Luteococcus peritonei]
MVATAEALSEATAEALSEAAGEALSVDEEVLLASLLAAMLGLLVEVLVLVELLSVLSEPPQPVRARAAMPTATTGRRTMEVREVLVMARSCHAPVSGSQPITGSSANGERRGA